MPPRLIGIVRVEVPAGIKRGRRERPDNRDKAAECGAGVWNIMIWHLEIQFLYIGMNNSREKVVWANLLLIISDLYLLGYYCHGWLQLNEVTDKNTQSKGFVRLVHRLKVQPQLQDLRSHFVEFIMRSFLFFFIDHLSVFLFFTPDIWMTWLTVKLKSSCWWFLMGRDKRHYMTRRRR